MITRTSSARSRGRRIAGCLVASLAADCGSTPVEPSLFRVAVGGAPGGAFLGVWVSPTEASAYLCGGYVGVDPTRVPSGGAGRLVGYREGRFTTLCRTPNVLWWVFSVEGAFPVEWKAPSLNAMASEVPIEELTLAYQSLTMEVQDDGT